MAAKVTVKIADRRFEVEVGDLSQQPVQAVIEGETFEVWVEDGAPAAVNPVPTSQRAPSAQIASAATRVAAPSVDGAGGGGKTTRKVLASLPGVIVGINVQAGAQVAAGQELCVLEAMKMRNIIRAPQDGKIVAIHVSVGQQVKHRHPLMEYASE